jgi:excisionase family DNA binding protein
MKKTSKRDLVYPKTQRKAITVQEASVMLALAPITIRKAIKSGRIKAIQISPKGRYRISSAQIEELMETKR